MSGVCSAHRYHDPDCERCTALPYDSRYEKGMEIIEVDLPRHLQLFLFKEIVRLNCRPSDYFKHVLFDYIKSIDLPEETDNPGV